VHRKVRLALRGVGLEHRGERFPLSLSGGEQQRAAVARALVGDPALLLADEPTGALDSKTGQEVLALFRELHAQGNTVLLVTHDRRMLQAVRLTRLITVDGGVVSERPV